MSLRDVDRREYLEVRFLRETPEVSSSSRGWAEGAVEHARVETDGDYHVLITVGHDEDEVRYRVSRQVINAIHNLWETRE